MLRGRLGSDAKRRRSRRTERERPAFREGRSSVELIDVRVEGGLHVDVEGLAEHDRAHDRIDDVAGLAKA